MKQWDNETKRYNETTKRNNETTGHWCRECNKEPTDTTNQHNTDTSAGFWQILLIRFDSHSQACDLIPNSIRFNSILIILDIYQVHVKFSQGKKIILTNAVKYTWESVGTTLL